MIITLLISILLGFSIQEKNQDVQVRNLANDHSLFANDSLQYKVYEQFEILESELFKSTGDKVTVINFWATWCGPCVKELPFFEALNQQDPNLDVVLVSLDFKNQLKRRLDPFLEKRQLTTDVVVLVDGNANKWIDMVDPEWSGTIPATLFIKGEKKIFVEQEFHSTDEIYEFINKLK